jgi:type IV pilus assembly protein PilP
MGPIRALPICLLLALAAHAGCRKDSPRQPANRDRTVTEPQPEPLEAEAAPEQNSVSDMYTYSPAAKRDPFRAPYGGPSIPGGSDDGRKRDPLERFDLDQLRLTGIIWGVPRPWAMVTTPDGLAFPVRPGSRIGKNGGRVDRIVKNQLVVAEQYLASNMRKITQTTSLMLRRSDKR